MGRLVKAFLSWWLGEADLPELLTPCGEPFLVGNGSTPPLSRVKCASLGCASVLSRKHCLNPDTRCLTYELERLELA